MASTPSKHGLNIASDRENLPQHLPQRPPEYQQNVPTWPLLATDEPQQQRTVVAESNNRFVKTFKTLGFSTQFSSQHLWAGPPHYLAVHIRSLNMSASRLNSD